jgi:hypothetical protein
MSVHITGNKERVVEKVQSRLDKFSACSKAYQQAWGNLNEWKVQKVELADLPAHEDRYHTILDQYKKASDELKYAAAKIEEKTDKDHIKKYFKSRYSETWGTQERYIDLQFKEYLEGIHEQAKKILEIDFADQVAQEKNESTRRKTEAQAMLEFSQIDRTFPSHRDRLFNENPVEYLRQSVLYQDKLFEKQDESAVLDFGNAWIKNLPKEATWEQVEKMSFIMAQTANGTVDLTEYRVAVEQWLKEHPLPENPSDSTPQSKSALDRRTYVLGLLCFYNQKIDLTPEAFQLYKSCSALYPDQQSWKVAQALYHISKLQWEEAEQLLADLPQDDAAVIHTQKYLADSKRDHLCSVGVAKACDYISKLQWLKAKQLLEDLPQDDASVREAQIYWADRRRERLCSAALDLGALGFSYLAPTFVQESGVFDMAQTTISNGPVRRVLIPLLSGTSDQSILSELSLSSGASVVGDFVDFTFRNVESLEHLQSVENFGSCAARITNLVWTLYSNPEMRSFPSFLSLGSLVISARQSSDAFRGIDRPASQQALLSTVKLMSCDMSAGITLLSYSDIPSAIGIPILKIVNQIGANFNITPLSDASEDSQDSSKAKWIAGALIVGVVFYRFYNDYPCLWAASIMKNAELRFSQGKYEDVQLVFTESENSYFVSNARPVVKKYAAYLKWLQDYPMLLDDSEKSTGFLKDLDEVLGLLKKSSHYRGIRHNVLKKKMETAVRQQDSQRLIEVLKERPLKKIVVEGFNCLLKCSFYLALRDSAAACSFLQKVGPSFPSRCGQIIESLVKLLQTESNSLQVCFQLNLLTVTQNTLPLEQVKHWNTVLLALQEIFAHSVGETEVCQQLQYRQFILSFAETDNPNLPQALFKESDVKLQQRFVYDLVHYTRQLWQAGKHQEAVKLLERVQFDSFTDNQLIQEYGHYLSLLHSKPLPNACALELEKLDVCIAGLDTKNYLHQQLQVLFSAYRIVLNFDAGKQPIAQELLAQEIADSKVRLEVAAVLFDRIFAPLQKVETKEALNCLNIVKFLVPLEHQELFNALQSYLECKSSNEVQIERLSPLITLLTPIEQLSYCTFYFNVRKHCLQFELRLSQQNLEAAKQLLSVPIPKAFESELCNTLFIFFVNRGQQQLFQRTPVTEVRVGLQELIEFFAPPNSDKIQSYINFLIQLEGMENEKGFRANQEKRQLLQIVFENFKSLKHSVPVSLKIEMAHTLNSIAFFVSQRGDLKNTLSLYEEIKQLEVPLEGPLKDLDRIIIHLKDQINAQSSQGE